MARKEYYAASFFKNFQVDLKSDCQEELADGRCRFTSENRKMIYLLYVKNGVVQKGPLLYFDVENETVKIRSKTTNVGGNFYHMTAEIKADKKGASMSFIDGKLQKRVESVD